MIGVFMGAKHKLKYHVVLTTKYRKPALAGLKEEVKAAFGFAEKNSHFCLVAVGVENGNHVHLIIRTTPSYSVASIVNRMKVLSMNYLWNNHEELLCKVYWGKQRKLWSGGYFVSSLGDVSEKIALEYATKDDDLKY